MTHEPRPDVRTSPFRSRVEHASHPLAQRLTRLPAAAVTAVLVLVILVAALVRGYVGAGLLALVTLFSLWLAFLSWPRLALPDRLMRVATMFLTASVALLMALSAG